MQRTSHSFGSLLKIVSCAVLLLGVAARAEDKKADPAGTWTWTVPGRNGGPDRTNSLVLKMDDAKLTGKLTSPGRDGQKMETAIADGKVDGDTISFTIVREFNGNSMTNKYSGKITADKIVGKSEFNRNGEAQSREWEAKRTEEKK